MNQKQALLSLRLGNKIARAKWSHGTYLYLENNTVIVNYYDDSVGKFTIDDFLTQEHNDWVVYCPQGNKQNS